jgi:hypothetical protein
MGAFNPQEHLIDIRGKQYLEVKWRLVWLRQEHPDWSIITEVVEAGEPVIVKATVADGTGRVIATGHAEYPRGRQFPGVMKAETAAVGRALAHSGFGTQFGGEDVEEVEIVDAAVSRTRVTRVATAAPPPRRDGGLTGARYSANGAAASAPAPGSRGPAGPPSARS